MSSLSNLAARLPTEEFRLMAESRRVEIDFDDFRLGTPMYQAARCGKYDTIRELMRLGCMTINHPNRHGATPMHVAAGNGNFKCVQVLVEFGATVNVLDANQRSPLQYAVEGNHYQIVEFILTRCSLRPEFLTIPDHTGLTALHLAAARCDSNMIRLLVIAGCRDLEANDGDGYTPLSLVLQAPDPYDTAGILIMLGANTNLEIEEERQPEMMAILNQPISEAEISACRYDVFFSRSLTLELLQSIE